MLDPGNKTSILRIGDIDITGPYFPGRLRGDRICLFVRPDLVLAKPQDGFPGPNQITAELVNTTETPRAIRLDFRGGFSAEIPPAEFETNRDNRDWVIEFPPNSLGVL